MSSDPDSPPKRRPVDSRQAERAAALRANLMRRKAQARGRGENMTGPVQGDQPPEPPADA